MSATYTAKLAVSVYQGSPARRVTFHFYRHEGGQTEAIGSFDVGGDDQDSAVLMTLDEKGEVREARTFRRAGVAEIRREQLPWRAGIHHVVVPIIDTRWTVLLDEP